MKKFRSLFFPFKGPTHPFDAVINRPDNGTPCGLGLMMRAKPEDLPAYNLVYALHPNMMSSFDEMGEAVHALSTCRELIGKEWKGYILGEVSGTMSLQEIKEAVRALQSVKS